MKKYSAQFGRMAAVGVLGIAAVSCGNNAGLDPEYDRFKAMPDMCSLLSEQIVTDTLGGQPEVKPSGGGQVGSCAWSYTNNELTPDGSYHRIISLNGSLFRGDGSTSGADKAFHELERIQRDSPTKLEQSPGIGERAIKGQTRKTVDYIIVIGNLNLQLSYENVDLRAENQTAPPPQTNQQAQALASEIAKKVSGS